MSRSLRAAVLLVAILAASLAPTAAVHLHAEGREAGGCCARDAGCDAPRMQAACCPCAPQVPADAAPAGVSAPPPVAVALPASAAAASAVLSQDLAHQRLRACTLALAVAAADPPWLLNASLLI